jgi:solute carrier family 12 sodium/potassium/chloride transporter 2
MNAPYALVSLIIMGGIYLTVSGYKTKEKGLVNLFRGVVFQLSRQLQILAQRADREDLNEHWRPFTICVSQDTFMRRSAFDMLRWISLKYGFGTYIHYIKGFLTEETNQESREVLNKLIHLAAGSKNRVYLDTIISPSYTSAIAQVIQLSGISGKGNNMILFEFSAGRPEHLEEALNTHPILYATGFDLCVLSTSYKGFGYKKQIHIWITPDDYDNANLMILLGYIILGHPEWKEGIIKIFAIHQREEEHQKREELRNLIREGRLPISLGNINLVSAVQDMNNRDLICDISQDADLTVVGFRQEQLKTGSYRLFTGYDKLGNILFVSANKNKDIN